MSRVAAERMIIGRGYAHDANAINFNTTSTNFNASAAATYNATGANQQTFHNAACRFALVANDSATDFLTVTVGTVPSGSGVSAQGAAPSNAGGGSRRVYPRSQEFIQLENDGPSTVNIKADTNACLGALVWYP